MTIQDDGASKMQSTNTTRLTDESLQDTLQGKSYEEQIHRIKEALEVWTIVIRGSYLRLASHNKLKSTGRQQGECDP